MRTALIGIVLATVTAVAQSAPITVYFTGLIASFRDYSTGLYIPAYEGQIFTGYATYDATSAQTVTSDSSPSFTWSDAHSYSGCDQVTNGLCTQNSGTHGRTLTDYQFSWSGGTYVPFSLALGYYEASGHYAQSRQPPFQAWNAYIDQRQQTITGDPSASYVSSWVRRSIEIAPYAENKALLTGSALDLTTGFSLAAVAAGQRNIFLDDYSYAERCTVSATGPQCNFIGGGYHPGSAGIRGVLTNVAFREGSVVPIPEPATLSLVAAALLGITATRRRKPTTASC